MKIDEIHKKLGELYSDIRENYNKYSPSEIDKIVSDVDRMREEVSRLTKTSPEGANTIAPVLLTASEAAEYLSVSRQTIYNYVRDKLLKSRGIGGHHRFTYEDLNKCRFMLQRPKAYCFVSMICLERKEGKLATFKKNEKYEIMRENKIWVYLFNEKWVGSFRISKKQFRKNFSVKGEMQYDAVMYNL